MTVLQETISTTQIATTRLQLNAMEPKLLMEFYRDKIGLTVLSENSDGALYTMGTKGGLVLLELFQAEVEASRSSTGLYHMAFRLPTRRDLSQILKHMVQEHVYLTGASDHGYSNALYLDDPEGNGIEIYWDKPEDEWDHLDDGRIGGIVERLDVESLIELETAPFDGMPEGSDLGHMHIHVASLEESWNFYRDILGLGFKYRFGEQAIFMATGGYHHHLGANTWKGRNLKAIRDGEQGLRNYSWQASEEDFNAIRENLKTHNISYTESDSSLSFKDNSGISIAILR